MIHWSKNAAVESCQVNGWKKNRPDWTLIKLDHQPERLIYLKSDYEMYEKR